MTTVFTEFQKKFRVEELLLHRTQYWSISVRPTQPTLGSMIISLNRYCARIADLESDESEAFVVVARAAEDILSNSFKPECVNYLALMMVDKHVHFHFVPRYEGSREFRGRIFHDFGWPNVPVLTKNNDMNNADLQELVDFLQ